MFKSLYESFENPAVTELENNITRYQSLEPNYVVFNNQNDYAFPNAGTKQQQAQSSNAALQAALNNLGSVFVPGTTTGQMESTDIDEVGKVLTGIPDTIQERVRRCRQYEGLVGLSNLQKAQTNQMADERCGWRYKSGRGVVPEVAQAAYGNQSGPLDPAKPSFDFVGNGTQYIWDLQTAEKTMVKDICKAATQCIDMTAVPLSAAGEFSNVCGYCETSKKIIPIKVQNGVASPRYNDVDSQCAPEKIITMKDAKQKCPQPPPGAPPSVNTWSWKCLNANKLDRDCIALTSYFAGCGSEGSLLTALSQGKNQQDYADLLRNQKSFKAYQELSQVPLSDDVIGTGNTTLFAAFMNNYSLNRNMYNMQNINTQAGVKRWAASVDLCYRSGFYDLFNFCDELQDSDKDYELKCMQQYFLQSGGTAQGSDYPTGETMNRLKGSRNWGQYKGTVEKLKQDVQSKNLEIQKDSINKFMGLNIIFSPTKLPRGESSQGVEVFYFDSARATFLGRRAYLSAAGRNLPNFNVGGGVVENTGLVDNVEIIYIYDIRPDNDLQLALGVVTDDGWAIAKNQNVYNIKDWSNGANWWYDQGPTWHNTSAMSVSAESRGSPNIFMGAWYERGGGAVHHPFYKIGPTVYNQAQQAGWVEIGRGNTPTAPIDQFWKNNCYFVQEDGAPSIQFEVLQPKNYYTQGLHFVEKRLWGAPSLRDADMWRTAQQKGQEFSKVGTPFAEGTYVMTLRNSNQYSISGSIAFSAIRTWTICFKIDTYVHGRNLTFSDLIWMRSAFGGPRTWAVRVYDIKSPDEVELELVYYGPKGGKSAPKIRVPMKKWCMCVVHLVPENMSSRNITQLNMFVQTVDNLKVGKILDGTRLISIPAGNEGVLFNDVARDRRDAGKMILGTARGDGEEKTFVYAWVHGFDDVIAPTDIESWRKEANRSWLGRWYE